MTDKGFNRLLWITFVLLLVPLFGAFLAWAFIMALGKILAFIIFLGFFIFIFLLALWLWLVKM